MMSSLCVLLLIPQPISHAGKDVPFESFLAQGVHSFDETRDGVYSLQHSLDGTILAVGFGDGSMEVSVHEHILYTTYCYVLTCFCKDTQMKSFWWVF